MKKLFENNKQNFNETSYSLNVPIDGSSIYYVAYGGNADNMEKLWSDIMNYGLKVRSKRLNGLDMWVQLKGKLSEITYEGQWSMQFKDIKEYMMKEFGLVEDVSHILKDIWEKHHFYLQHANIPSSNNCSFVRLMQIAYNAGQLKAIFDDPIFTKDMKDYYDNMHLNEMTTYMDKDQLLQMGKMVSDEYVKEVENLLKI